MNTVSKLTVMPSGFRGFTLVELMITLVIATILLTMGVPSFTAMIKNNRLTTDANEFVAAMNYARSEAIKRSATMTVASTNGDNTWEGGWTIDDPDGNTLRVFPALGNNMTLTSNENNSSFLYAGSGRVNNDDTLALCDDRTGETGRLITITTTGRVSMGTTVCP